MAGAKQLRRLREMSDEDLIWEHDVQAEHTVVGIDYFLDELHRRETIRAAEASNRLAEASVKLARRSYWLSVISAATSVAALVVAVVTLAVTTH